MSSATGSRDDRDSTAPEASLPSFLRAVETISSDLDTTALLDQLVLAACDLIGARYGALIVLGAGGRVSQFVTHGVDRPPHPRLGPPPAACGLAGVGDHGGALRLEDLTRHPRFAGFPPHHPALRTLLFAPIRVRGTEFGSLYLSERADGAVFTAEDQAQVTALAQLAGFVVENAHAYALSERRRRWLEMFSELNEVLQPPVSVAEALRRVTSAVRIASGAVAAAIIQVPDRAEPEVAARSGDGSAFWPLTTELQESARAAVSSGEVLEVALDNDVSALVAPLRAHLATPGVLVIAHDLASRPDHVEERDLLASFADHVALSLDRTQALQEREEMAVVADRDRIARELHDVVIQRLFATGLHLQSARASATDPGLRARISEVVVNVDQTIRDIRSTIFSLQNRPQDSLRAEVRELVREFVPQLGFAPSVQLQGRVDQGLGPQVQPVFLAVLREALTNVAKHARAGSVSIDVRVSEERVQLRVSDNGQGIPDQRAESGLRHARRRALLLGGSLDLWPHEPNGTIFVWSVPLRATS